MARHLLSITGRMQPAETLKHTKHKQSQRCQELAGESVRVKGLLHTPLTLGQGLRVLPQEDSETVVSLGELANGFLHGEPAGHVCWDKKPSILSDQIEASCEMPFASHALGLGPCNGSCHGAALGSFCRTGRDC